jgi:hypothetical protein
MVYRTKRLVTARDAIRGSRQEDSVSADVGSDVLTSTQLQRNPLGNQIADTLRREILLGTLQPGTRVSQQQLCERF